MRSTLFAVGAFLFLSYPLVMLFAIVEKLDPSGGKPDTAAIDLTSRAADLRLERETGRRTGIVRNTTIRGSR